MQILQQLQLSLAFVILSTVVYAVPIQTAEDTAVADDSIVWVTETVWPCEAPLATGLVLATDTAMNTVGRGTAQRKQDYDTVPVDGGDNSEAVPAEASPNTVIETPTPVDAQTAAPITAGETVSTDTISTETALETTLVEIPVYTAVGPETTVDSSTTMERNLDTQFTIADSDTTSAMTSSTSAPVPVLTTKSPAVFLANSTSTSLPTMPIILPTFTPSNMTNTTCTTGLPEADEYTPEEESAYWATATEPSISYSDYTVMVTVKSTSVMTVQATQTADAIAATVTTSTTTTNSLSISSETGVSSMMPLPYSNSSSPSTTNVDVTYTLDALSKVAEATASSNASRDTAATILSDPTSSAVPVMLSTPTTAAADAPLETVSGTVITYVDETTTVSSDSSITTVYETVLPTDVVSTDTGYDTTTTTTVATTSTIIVEETANAKIRRRILVTRAGM
jgi:trimeric autotransporter adhesin